MPLRSGLFSLVCRGATDALEFREAGVVGVAQVFALLAGISRSDMTMMAGLSAVSTTTTRHAFRSCGPRRSCRVAIPHRIPDANARERFSPSKADRNGAAIVLEWVSRGLIEAPAWDSGSRIERSDHADKSSNAPPVRFLKVVHAGTNPDIEEPSASPEPPT